MKEYTTDSIRNIAFIGHNGSGKTTLSEILLFTAHEINRIGNIAEGNTVSDYTTNEIEKQISISTSLLHLEWNNIKINILDTPGYSDFIGDVKSAMRVCDTAVMVLKSAEGIEVGSETTGEFINEYGLPSAVIINKIDNEHSKFEETEKLAKERLSSGAVIVSFPASEGVNFDTVIDVLKMKMLKSKDLIAYASSFVSFILSKIKAKEIILFGSAARGEAGKESDIDLFVNVENNEKEIKKTINKEINKFYKSKIADAWILKGIKNPLAVKVGNLDKWKLKRSIISEGIVLYGRYKESPEKMRGFSYFNLSSIKNIAKRNFILRKLFGRKEKGYSAEGLLKKTNGKKLSSLSFVIPIEHTQETINLLNANKIDYKFFEFWSDQI